MSRFWSRMRKNGPQSGGKSGRKSGRRQRRPLWGAEQLEGRRLMAIVAYMDDGYRDGEDGLNFIADWAGLNDSYHPELIGLHIVGTEQNDTVEIFESNGVLNVKLTNADGSQELIREYSINTPNIFFHGKGGDDVFRSNAMARTYAWGDGGKDTLDGGNGEVHLFGGDQDDTLTAGPQAYGFFFGEGGNDTLIGTERENQMWGGSGFDRLYGGGGVDYLSGGAQDDVIHGGMGDDVIFGDGGDDKLYGGWGDDSLDGAAGDDLLDGGRGMDFLYGGDNTDHLFGGPDDDYDYLAGDRGADVFHVNYSGLIDGSVNPDDYADFRSSTGDRFDHSDVQNIVLDVVSLTDLSGPSPLSTMSVEETPEWIDDAAEWPLVSWERPPLESLDGIALDVLPTVEDAYADADPLTEFDVVDELLPIDWTEADGDDVGALELDAYDALYLAFDDQAPADEVAFDEPIDQGTVDSYFGDLDGSSSSSSGLSNNAIGRTSGWFGRY